MAARTKKAPVETNGEPAGPVNRIAELEAKEATKEVVKIKPLVQKTLQVTIIGTAPFMQHRFSQKAAEKMRRVQEAGTQSRSRKEREARDFKADFEAATYRFRDGSFGIPASAFRKAMISACRTCGFAMTLAKLSVFTEKDGTDAVDNCTPLVRLNGKPEMDVRPARNDNGSCDLRARPRFDEWSATIRVRFDLGQFSVSDIVNLLIRVGQQVGIGEGRPDSPNSAGIDYGLFRVDLDSMKVSG